MVINSVLSLSGRLVISPLPVYVFGLERVRRVFVNHLKGYSAFLGMSLIV